MSLRPALSMILLSLLATSAVAKQQLAESERLAQCVIARSKVLAFQDANPEARRDRHLVWTDSDIQIVTRDMRQASDAIGYYRQAANDITSREVANVAVHIENLYGEPGGCGAAYDVRCLTRLRDRLGAMMSEARAYRERHPDLAEELAIMDFLRCQLLRSTSGVPDPSRWAGFYTDGRYEFTLIANGGEVTAQGRATFEDNVAQWRNCRQEGDSLRCDLSGTYRDADKTIVNSGYIIATLSGDRLNFTSHVVDTTVTWTGGRELYQPGIRPGASFPASLQRRQSRPQP